VRVGFVLDGHQDVGRLDMRACQLCGCKSWGPEKTPHPEKQARENQALSVAGPFVECDGCGALAREDLVNDPAPLLMTGSGTTDLGAPSPSVVLQGLAGAREALKGMLPDKDPETRTERLVRELIAGQSREGSGQSTNDYARWLVECASQIEAQLDAREAAVIQIQQANLISNAPATPIRTRNFQQDFLAPALNALGQQNREAIALALDCAIAFGALEGQTANSSLKLSWELESLYWDKVQRLQVMVY